MVAPPAHTWDLPCGGGSPGCTGHRPHSWTLGLTATRAVPRGVRGLRQISPPQWCMGLAAGSLGMQGQQPEGCVCEARSQDPGGVAPPPAPLVPAPVSSRSDRTSQSYQSVGPPISPYPRDGSDCHSRAVPHQVVVTTERPLESDSWMWYIATVSRQLQKALLAMPQAAVQNFLALPFTTGERVPIFRSNHNLSLNPYIFINYIKKEYSKRIV